jgi:hypothetical protein
MRERALHWKVLAGVLNTARKAPGVRHILAHAREQWIEESDEFVTWLTFANAGMTHPGSRYCLSHAIQHLPGDAPIIEIGAFCGLSTNLIAHYCRKHGRGNPVIVSDRWDFENRNGDRIGDAPLTHAQYRAFVRESFLRNIQLFSSDRLPWPVELDSDAFFAAWRRGALVTDALGRSLTLGGPISFAVIDGNHSYEFARRDFANSDEFLVPGGFVFLDDSADDSPFEGVRRVVQEIRASGRYALAARNPHYLFRKL